MKRKPPSRDRGTPDSGGRVWSIVEFILLTSSLSVIALGAIIGFWLGGISGMFGGMIAGAAVAAIAYCVF